MARNSLIDFCIVSLDLFLEVLYESKQGAKLPTDHHFIVEQKIA